jgi:LmbE family N-acetylglucosaminyl deacetylase
VWAGVPRVEPDDLFSGVVLITVPHMDDEVLACGGTIARLSDKRRVHLVYATDGMKAPEPILPWRDAISPDLGAIRRRESVAAMTLLGVPESNIRFLQLPEARLEKHQRRLFALMRDLVDEIGPDHVLTPFRYDRHRDHIAVNRAATAATRAAGRHIQLAEYFVYHHWRLLPKTDVRRYIRMSELRQVDIADASERKRAALECFKSQTTRFYPWQSRPNLTSNLLDSVSREPELLLIASPSLPGASVFTGSVAWIRMAHRLESPLKRVKDRAVAVWQRTFA